MTAAAPAPPPPVVQREPWLHSVHPVYRLVFRWVFIAATTFLAFHTSLRSVVEVTRGGSLGGYVWVVPIAGGLAAIGVARRHRTELPIHDRQTDVIVGTMGLVLAGLLHAVLLQRYALYFYLLRLDLVAMWTFTVSASIALFGLRPVLRFGWVWLLLSTVFALPYYLVVITLGGTKVAAALGTMIIAGIAAGISVHRDTRRGMIGSSLGWAVGILIIVVMAVWFAPALVAFEWALGSLASTNAMEKAGRIKLIGVIPESETVLQASNQGLPAIHLQGTDVSEAYKDVIDRFMGEDKPMRFTEAEKPGFFKRLFGGK